MSVVINTTVLIAVLRRPNLGKIIVDMVMTTVRLGSLLSWLLSYAVFGVVIHLAQIILTRIGKRRQTDQYTHGLAEPMPGGLQRLSVVFQKPTRFAVRQKCKMLIRFCVRLYRDR